MSELNSRLFRDDPAAYYVELGAKSERERIIKLLEPYASHDEEMCYMDGKLICYPEDCSAFVYRHALQIIQETDNQENLNYTNLTGSTEQTRQHERTDNPSNGDDLIPEKAKSARTSDY